MYDVGTKLLECCLLVKQSVTTHLLITEIDSGQYKLYTIYLQFVTKRYLNNRFDCFNVDYNLNNLPLA